MLHRLILVIFVVAAISYNIASAQNEPSPRSQIAYFENDHGTYSVSYEIINGTLIDTPLDLPARELIFVINATGQGKLTVQLPRDVIDSTRDGKDKPFLVLGGMVEKGLSRINAKEVENNNQTRTLEIKFVKEYNQIGIVGTYFVENNSPYKENVFGVLPPLQQYENGFDIQDIICKQDLTLVIKSEDDSPACVRPGTAIKLMTWGWTKSILDKTGISIHAYSPHQNQTK